MANSFFKVDNTGFWTIRPSLNLRRKFQFKGHTDL